MTISVASIIQQEDESHGWDNLAPVAGSWDNFFWDQGSDGVRWGRLVGKFTFLFEKIVWKFTNLTPTVPANAVIVSAVLRGTAIANSDAQVFITVIRSLATDGAWNVSSLVAWRSASALGPLAILNTDMDVAVLNAFLTTLVDTGITINRRWAVRDNGASRAVKAGQGVEIVTGGTIVFVDISLSRLGTVAVGNVWVEIYSQDANGLADVLQATSDTRPASAMLTSMSRHRFTFSGGELITVVAGQDIVVVLNGDYPASETENIGVGWSTGGYAPGTFQLFGTGVGFDEQNYPMQRNFRNILGTGFIIWFAPQFFTGVDYDTPSFAAMLQSHIQTSGYVEGDPLGFSVERSPFAFPEGTADRQWAGSTNPTFGPVRLIVDWREISPPATICLVARLTNKISLQARHDVKICLEARYTPKISTTAKHTTKISLVARHTPKISLVARYTPKISKEGRFNEC